MWYEHKWELIIGIVIGLFIVNITDNFILGSLAESNKNMQERITRLEWKVLKLEYPDLYDERIERLSK